MKYDLHIHSNISDGKQTREQILQKAIEEGLEYISFTEHNKFVPVDCNDNINIINGIEFDTYFEKSFHAIMYFKNIDKKIQDLIQYNNENVNDRSEMLLKQINHLHNINVNLEIVQRFFNKKYIFKRDVIEWLISNNYAKSVNEASNKFTGKNAISYIPKFSVDFKKLVNVSESMGGKLILAHPSTLRYTSLDLELFIKRLTSLGLDGIEVINTSKIDKLNSEIYINIANKYNLLTSGGSDFHSFEENKLGVKGEEAKRLIKTLKF